MNGSGKTTTAGKLARQWHQRGKTVILAAGDTFRAAATEQLQIWVPHRHKGFAGDQGGDVAALAYAALETAQKEQVDVLIFDIAGRLQNRMN